MNDLFIKIFKSAYDEYYVNLGYPELKLSKDEYVEVNETLIDVVNSIIGFRVSGNYNLSEVRLLFDNICKNLPFDPRLTLSMAINKYKNDYLKMILSHPYTTLLISVLNTIYSAEYEGLFGLYTFANKHFIVSHYKDALTIGKMPRMEDDTLPYVLIRDIDKLEKILEKYIKSIENSTTYYNLFKNEYFMDVSNEDKIRMVLEGTLFNASSYDLANISCFFHRYNDFINDDIMPSLKGLDKIGDAFNDELYFKVKESDIEYETPYYFSFMLKNHRIELPNVRLGIKNNDNGEKIAHIVALQSSQITKPNPTFSDEIKEMLPKSSKYRNYNPDHLVSLVLSLGLLNGLGITRIEVQDYMPLRGYKTIKNFHMNEFEGFNYLNRVVSKNIATYLKLTTFTEDVKVSSLPFDGVNMILETSEKVMFNNIFLNYLYNLAYEYGLSQKEKRGFDGRC